jgi:hypothetical protein
MTGDIFKLFKNSIESVKVMKTERGTLNQDVVYTQTLEAIVKRRNAMAEAVNESEDRNSTTSIHFRPADAQYIEIGNFVQIDGAWQVIERIRDGKDFDKGKTDFIYAFLGDEIIQLNDEPIWGDMVSA